MPREGGVRGSTHTQPCEHMLCRGRVAMQVRRQPHQAVQSLRELLRVPETPSLIMGSAHTVPPSLYTLSPAYTRATEHTAQSPCL